MVSTKNNTLDINKLSKLQRTTTETARRRYLSEEDKTTIEWDIKQVLASKKDIVGPAEFAQQHTTTNHVIRYHFADLYSQHRALYDRQEKEKRLKVRQQRVQRVRDATQSLVRQGIYPSQRKLKATGKVCASDLTRTDVRYALKPITHAYKKQSARSKLRDSTKR